jgi:hypothetical protein
MRKTEQLLTLDVHLFYLIGYAVVRADGQEREQGRPEAPALSALWGFV